MGTIAFACLVGILEHYSFWARVLVYGSVFGLLVLTGVEGSRQANAREWYWCAGLLVVAVVIAAIFDESWVRFIGAGLAAYGPLTVAIKMYDEGQQATSRVSGMSSLEIIKSTGH